MVNWPWTKKEVVKEPEEITGKFEVKSVIDQDDGQVRIEVDWDNDFIEHLRRLGYLGTEDAIVQRYITESYRNVLNDMGEL